MNRKLTNWTMHGTHGEDEMTDENILNILSYSYFLVCPFLALVFCSGFTSNYHRVESCRIPATRIR